MSIWKVGRSDDYLMHYGIPRRSGRYPYGSGERPFQGEERSKVISSSADMAAALKKKGFSIESELDPYTWTMDHKATKDFATKDGLGRDLSVSIYISFSDREFEKDSLISEQDLSSAVDNMTKNFSTIDKKIRNQVAEELLADNRIPWAYEDSGMSKSQMKNQLINDIGVGYNGKLSKPLIYFTPLFGGGGDIGYDDGDAYYGHLINVEMDWVKGKKFGHVSLQG